MCDCPREWRTDPDSKGAHNQVVYTCDDYIADLEAQIRSLSSRADSDLGDPGKELDGPPYVHTMPDLDADSPYLTVDDDEDEDCGNCRYPKNSCPKDDCKWGLVRTEVLKCPHGSTNLHHCCNENNDTCTADCVEVPYTLRTPQVAQPLTSPVILCGNTCDHDHNSTNGPTGCCAEHGPYMYFCNTCHEARKASSYQGEHEA